MKKLHDKEAKADPKFIHYYTRYKAHGESALLESRYIQTGFDLTAYVRSYLEYRCIY